MNVSISEIFLILIIALLVIKPDQLPGVAHQIGKFIRSIRRLMRKVQEEVEEGIQKLDPTASNKKE